MHLLVALLHSSAIHLEATATPKDLHFIAGTTCDMLQRGLAKVFLEYEHLCSQSGDAVTGREGGISTLVPVYFICQR